MRVAVTQFATTANAQDNLTTCVRMINEAATCKPSLIVLPQYSNTHFCNNPFYSTSETIDSTTYNDHNHAWHDALSIDGSFMGEICQLAKQLSCYIVINVTLRQDDSRTHNDGTIKSNISVTSCLFSPDGNLVHQQHKTALTAHENQFFISKANTVKVVPTALGNIGLLSGNDSLCFNVARDLSLAGAQLLCNAMDNGSKDQSNYHDPTRANENNLYVLSANKINPDEQLINHSQIISPEGRVRAKVNCNKDSFTFTDIDMNGSGFKNKLRPDGTTVSEQHNSGLYQSLAHSHSQQASTQHQEPSSVVELIKETSSASTSSTTNVAIFATYKSNEEAINDVCHYIENNLSDIIQLPELFFIADKSVTKHVNERDKIAALSQKVINQVSAELRPFQYLCTSLIIDDKHQAVIIDQNGLFAAQPQLHFCERYKWTQLTNNLNIVDLPLENGSIKLAMLTADDANIPEIINRAAVSGIHVLLAPFDIQEPNEVTYNLISRAIENNICIVAASREKNFSNNLTIASDPNSPFAKNKVKVQKSTGLIINLAIKLDAIPKWKIRKFSGYINEPIVKEQFGKITKSVIHPIAAGFKL